jgi:hypothetical protein
MVKKKKCLDTGGISENIVKYFCDTIAVCRIICPRCTALNRVESFQKKTIKCSYCRKRIPVPESPVSPGAMLEDYLIRSFDSEDDKTFTMNAYSPIHGYSKLRILKPPYLEDHHEASLFLKEILQEETRHDKIVRTGRDSNILFQEIVKLEKDEYPEFLEFKKAFIAGKNSINDIFLTFIATAYPRFYAKNFGVDIKDENIISKRVIAGENDTIQFAVVVRDELEVPRLIIDMKFSTKINKERIRRAERILESKYPGQDIKKVVISFSDQNIPGWQIMNISAYSSLLNALFEKVLSCEWGRDKLLIIYYLKYLSTYSKKIYSLKKEKEILYALFDNRTLPEFVHSDELHSLEKRLSKLPNKTPEEQKRYRALKEKGIDSIIWNREKYIHNKMLWKNYFNEHRREYFEHFIIPEDDYCKSGNPMTHRYMNLISMVNQERGGGCCAEKSFGETIKEDDGVDPEVYPYCAAFAEKGGLSHTNVLFEPLHDVLLKYQLQSGTEAALESLNDAVTLFYRTLAKFAVAQFIFVKQAAGKNVNSDEITTQYFKKADSIEEYIRVISDIQQGIEDFNYRKYAVRLPLPTLYRYNTESLNVKMLVQYINTAEIKDTKLIYDILLEEVNKFPFFNYPVNKTKLRMQTPVGYLDLRTIYKTRLGNYENTDVVVKIPYVDVAGDRIEDSLKLQER